MNKRRGRILVLEGVWFSQIDSMTRAAVSEKKVSERRCVVMRRCSEGKKLSLKSGCTPGGLLHRMAVACGRLRSFKHTREPRLLSLQCRGTMTRRFARRLNVLLQPLSCVLTTSCRRSCTILEDSCVLHSCDQTRHRQRRHNTPWMSNMYITRRSADNRIKHFIKINRIFTHQQGFQQNQLSLTFLVQERVGKELRQQGEQQKKEQLYQKEQQKQGCCTCSKPEQGENVLLQRMRLLY